MSFEKRPDSGPGQSELVDETLDIPPALAVLAERLSDDADSLARCFPACKADALAALAADTKAPASRQWPSVRRVAVVSGISAASVLVVLLGWQALLRYGRDDSVVERPPALLKRSGQMALLQDTGDFRRQSAESSVGEENVLKGLSGAEQEAVLDLIETHTAQGASLSI